MKNKKADNSINVPKKKLEVIENKIEIEKMKMKEIDNIEESSIAVNKSINNCIELLALSIKGENTKYMFSNMYNDNNAILANVSDIIDAEKRNTKKKLNDLYSEKTQIEKKLNKEEEKE